MTAPSAPPAQASNGRRPPRQPKPPARHGYLDLTVDEQVALREVLIPFFAAHPAWVDLLDTDPVVLAGATRHLFVAARAAASVQQGRLNRAQLAPIAWAITDYLVRAAVDHARDPTSTSASRVVGAAQLLARLADTTA